MFYSNHGPISYRFRDRRRFQSKLAKFSHPLYFAYPLKGFPLELGNGAGGQKIRVVGRASGSTKKFDGRTDRQTARRTDRWTDTVWQQRPRLGIASRGKNRKQFGILTVLVCEVFSESSLSFSSPSFLHALNLIKLTSL